MGLLELLIVLLVISWFFGFAIVPIGGGFIHILLVIALIIIVVRLARGQRI